ncbi:UDP-N-acetylmuramoyl-L-alanine--D-glutamate ligase [Alteromonas aestuariivivens]|uniref:UDP-N-acetylmuramoylalanine--D-glutamate ligase n=1 Tax=Alteromonas aestuariivivens TaxID=1938339 RepID=A0A3D8MFL1_9ALTE|nr:UDP-N-acetylmuramoyl-L-alanine--D-glutamate ligase [Alteromonas aestuariivivens]RDV29416.1 UDP-N-acetylmuramoyl-L-alanine--D-glutamate ligase [Alteromonas aestuariivivens]
MTQTLESKTVVVAGLGLTGQACVRFLCQHARCVSAWDTRADLMVPETVQVPVCLGEPEAAFWQGVDLLVLSPGIATDLPAILQARKAGVEVIGDVELFARMNTTPALGITGSNGKTTVTMLVAHILQQSGFNACAAGNVGTPVLDTLEESWDAIVLELSSFQLESTSSLELKAATILNLSDDHLDRHGSMQAYRAAKQRIFEHCERAVVWRAQPDTWPEGVNVPKVTFGLDTTSSDFGMDGRWITWQGEPVIDMDKTQLLGSHNALNVQAALALAMTMGVEPSKAAAAVYSFRSAAHRCVEVALTQGVRWIDDSKATNVGATEAALKGIGPGRQGKLILIAGGDGKGADLSALQPALDAYVDNVIGLGRDGRKICALAKNAVYVDSMLDAVKQAWKQAEAGDTVLLSPACASLDMFDNYAHRGEVFAQCIHEVTRQ